MENDNENITMNASDNVSSPGDVTDNTNPRLVNGVVVLLLLLFNLSGNGVVFYIYHFLSKKNVFSLLVKTMAGLDLATTATMLMDVMMKMRPTDESNLNLQIMCKLTHFEVYATSLANGCILTLIAYERYRKICHPLKPGITLKNARLLIFLIMVLSLLLSIFTLIINGPQHIQVLVQGHVVTTTICRYDENFKGTALQTAFSFLLLSAFCMVLCFTAGFYILIYRALRSFERRTSVVSQSSDAISPTAAELNESYGFTPDPVAKRQRPHLQPRMSVLSFGAAGSDRVSAQINRAFTVITVVFVLSYLPHLVVLILNKALLLDHQVLTYGQRLALELAYNCPYMSTVANPFVYGFRSADFRTHCKQLLQCKKRRRSRSCR